MWPQRSIVNMIPGSSFRLKGVGVAMDIETVHLVFNNCVAPAFTSHHVGAPDPVPLVPDVATILADSLESPPPDQSDHTDP